MAGFKVKIGADTIELTKSLGELQKDLIAFKKQLSGVTNAQEFIRLNQAISQTERQIKGLTGAQNINALGQSVRQLPPGFSHAGIAVSNFSRIVQDAPFAFLQNSLVAVSNNIDPFIQSFVQLKQQTGSSGAALKALASSLTGSGGLLLGFSLVNAAITFFSAQNAYAKNTVEGFAKAQSEANKEAGEEIANLRVLAAVSGNATNSSKERKSAAEQLQKALKANNVELSQEAILNNNAAKAIDTATQAILSRARARAIENRIAELTGDNLDREIKQSELTEKLASAQDKLNKLQEKGARSKKIAGAPELRSADLQLQEVFVSSLTEQIKDLDDETTKATAEIDDLLTKATSAAPKTGGKDAVVDLLKRRIDALKRLQSETGLAREQTIELAQLEIQLVKRDSGKLAFTKEEVQQQIDSIIAKAFPNEFLSARFKIHVLGEIDPAQVQRDLTDQVGKLSVGDALGITQIDTAAFDPMIKKMKEASAAKSELARIDKLKEMADFVVGALQPAFTDLFESLISGGKNAFQELAQALGQIIKRLIAAAAAAALLAGIVTLITGGTGAGAASFGANFKSIFGGFTGFQFAEGGIATRATRGIFGEAGPEAVIPLARLPQIIGQMNNSGGSGGEFIARIIDGGRDLILVMNRANKSFNRNF